MTEREMEDLLWQYPDKLLDERLQRFARQPSSAVGRADLVFLDKLNRLLVVEIKRGTLGRGAVAQVHDYFGMIKTRYPDTPVEMMVVANYIPPERRLACAQLNIECTEISEKAFRDVAAQVGYEFTSERREAKHLEPRPLERDPCGPNVEVEALTAPSPHKVEKGWFYLPSPERPLFLACVNARGSCSLRRFGAVDGVSLGKIYKSGDFQQVFASYLNTAVHMHVARQPNLERECKHRLPVTLLTELQEQIRSERLNTEVAATVDAS